MRVSSPTHSPGCNGIAPARGATAIHPPCATVETPSKPVWTTPTFDAVDIAEVTRLDEFVASSDALTTMS